VLDDLFARLSAHGALKPSSSVKSASPPCALRGFFSFGDESRAQNAGTDILNSQSVNIAGATKGSIASKSKTTAVSQGDNATQPLKIATKDETENTEHHKAMSRAYIEQLYLRQAADYLEALPSSNSVPVEIIKSVSKKLRSSYAPNAKLKNEEAEKLKARYASAILNYVNQIYNKAAKPITSDFAKKALQDASGDVLCVCAKLVEQKYISLEDIDNAAGLCKMISHALPEAEVAYAPATPKVVAITPVASIHKPTTPVPASKDPVEGLKAWPTQEKRETRRLSVAAPIKTL
jgi:hypothetical protein